MIKKEDYQRIVEICHELNDIMVNNELTAIETRIQITKDYNYELFVLQDRGENRHVGWAKDMLGETTVFDELLLKY